MCSTSPPAARSTLGDGQVSSLERSKGVQDAISNTNCTLLAVSPSSSACTAVNSWTYWLGPKGRMGGRVVSSGTYNWKRSCGSSRLRSSTTNNELVGRGRSSKLRFARNLLGRATDAIKSWTVLALSRVKGTRARLRLLTPLYISLLLAISQGPGDLEGPIVLRSSLGHITNLGRHNAQHCKMLSKMRVCQAKKTLVQTLAACPTPKRYTAHSSGRIMRVRFDVMNLRCWTQKFVPSSQVD
jgi:hypothetical protein